MIPLTEEILQIIKNDKLDWKYISSEIILSEDFIREFNRKLNFYSISRYQVLSEDFIREFRYNLKWEYISRYQALSEDFVEEFKNKIDFYEIGENENIPLKSKLKIMLYINNSKPSLKLQNLYKEFLNSISDSISDEKIEAFIVMEKLTEE